MNRASTQYTKEIKHSLKERLDEVRDAVDKLDQLFKFASTLFFLLLITSV